MKASQVSEIRCVQYELEIPIEASPARVWRALTDQVGSWWLPDFHMLGPDSQVELEQWAGGRLIEKNGERELLWYTLLAIDPGKSMSLVGYCTPEFGGPTTTMLTAKLSGSQGTTVLQLSDALYGRVSDKQVESLRGGWNQLFTEGLKFFVEKEK